MELLSIFTKHLSNIPGWRTPEKLIVIESDDWGSIRMPSLNAFENLTRAGIDLVSDEGSRFNKFDSLATVDDLSSLFGILESVHDSSGRHAVMTPFSLVANPDFKKIRNSNFTEYHYEAFTETLRKYPGCENAFDIWHQGIRERLFMPEFHGREHLNVRMWLKALQQGNENILTAFDNEMWGISTAGDPSVGAELQAAFNVVDTSDLSYQSEVISSGLSLFRELFGYRSNCFVPPNGPFNSSLEEVCHNEGIKYLSAPKIHSEPLPGGKKRIRIHWLGQRSRNGITYLTRNCHFEPSQQGKNWVDYCLRDISMAFKWHKPAVISSHRVNFIGAIHAANRYQGLAQLQLLLKTIVKTWPDSQFLTSAELGDRIQENVSI